VEFGIGVRGPKCLNDGPTRRSKKFSDRFSRFDTIPAVTDSQPATLPATQPASHVAVAIRLYAKASSLKIRRNVRSLGTIPQPDGQRNRHTVMPCQYYASHSWLNF